MKNDLKKWIKWLSYNIVHETPFEDLQNEMIQSGFSKKEIDLITKTIYSDPIFDALQLLKNEVNKGIALNKVIFQLNQLSTDCTKILRESRLSSKMFLK